MSFVIGAVLKQTMGPVAGLVEKILWNMLFLWVADGVVWCSGGAFPRRQFRREADLPNKYHNVRTSGVGIGSPC